MKNRKKRTKLSDRVTNLDVMPVQAPTRFRSIADMNAQDAAIEQAKQKVEQDAERDRLRAEHDTRVKEYWSQPVEDISGHLGMRDDNLSLPLGDIHPTAAMDFLEEAKINGVSLSGGMGGAERLGTFVESNAKHHPGTEVSSRSIKLCFDRLIELNCFAPGEISYTQEALDSVKEPAPKAPTFEDLLARHDGSDESDRAIRRKLQEEVVGPDGVYSELFRAWYQDVQEKYGISLNNTQLREAWEYIRARNLSPLRHESYNSARRFLVERGLLPPTTITNHEWLDREYQAKRLTDYEYRRRIRTAAIDQSLDKPVAQTVGV